MSVKPVENYGPQLSRPHVDTLNASRYANMKELRFSADGGVWRAAFAFDPRAKPLCSSQVMNQGEMRGYFTDS